MSTTQGWASTLSADRMRPSHCSQHSTRRESSGVNARVLKTGPQGMGGPLILVQRRSYCRRPAKAGTVSGRYVRCRKLAFCHLVASRPNYRLSWLAAQRTLDSIPNCWCYLRTRGLDVGLPIMFRTVSESPRPQREIVGALGRFVAAVIPIRRNEGSPFDWHETAMRFESGVIGLRTRWQGDQGARRIEKIV